MKRLIATLALALVALPACGGSSAAGEFHEDELRGWLRLRDTDGIVDDEDAEIIDGGVDALKSFCTDDSPIGLALALDTNEDFTLEAAGIACPGRLAEVLAS